MLYFLCLKSAFKIRNALNTLKQEFEGHRLEFKTNCERNKEKRHCELDVFDDNDIYNNNYEKIILKISEEFKQKYLKYKSKYLMLKKIT